MLKKMIVISSLFLLTACMGTKISQDNFNKVNSGMTLADVTGILGEPVESTSAGVGPVSGTSALWRDKEGNRIDIKFINNKVKFKNFKRASEF